MPVADRSPASPPAPLDLVDARAARFMQGTTGAVALAALATGAWPLLALPALQLTVVLRYGQRACLPCRLYLVALRPRLGPGPLEDARPPRFANLLGAGFLWSAMLAHLVGLHALGTGLAALVAALALLSAATGLCVGCRVYRLAARLRGVRGRALDRLDLEELGAAPGVPAVVQFTHPLCSDCLALSARLLAEGVAPLLVDVSRRPELARKYGVAVVPLAVAVAADGRVTRRLG
jgi:hypothetical protein